MKSENWIDVAFHPVIYRYIFLFLHSFLPLMLDATVVAAAASTDPVIHSGQHMSYIDDGNISFAIALHFGDDGEKG